MFLLETDEKSASPAMSSSSNEEGSGGGQWNNTDYIESVIPGFFDIIIVKIFHNFSLNIFFRTSH